MRPRLVVSHQERDPEEDRACVDVHATSRTLRVLLEASWVNQMCACTTLPSSRATSMRVVVVHHRKVVLFVGARALIIDHMIEVLQFYQKLLLRVLAIRASLPEDVPEPGWLRPTRVSISL